MIQHNQSCRKLHLGPNWLWQWGTFLLLATVYFVNLVNVDPPFPSIQIASEKYFLLQNKHSLGDLILVAAHKNIPIGIFCVVFLLIVPFVRNICHLHPRDYDSAGISHTVLRMVSHWDLLPLVALSLLLLNLFGPKKDAPMVHLGMGFYILLARETMMVIPFISGAQLKTPTSEKRSFGVRRSGTLTLSSLALAALIAGLYGPSFHIDTAGLLRTGPASITASIRMLFEHGQEVFAVILLVLSVLFPFSKIIALLWVSCFYDRISQTYLVCLEKLGPFSLLEVVALIVMMVAYSSMPLINSSVVPDWGYWSFVSSVFVNSIAVSLSSFSRVPIRKP